MIDRILKGLCFLSLMFLAFMLGIVASIRHSIFYTKTQEIFEYAQALQQEREFRKERFSWVLWTKEPEHKTGVTQADPQKYLPGLTLFTTNGARAFLVDMAGRVVHQWHLPYSAAFGAASHAVPEKYIYWEGAHVFPNGDLIALYEQVGPVVYGKGLVRLDKDSHVLWAHKGHMHHVFSFDPAGNIYAMTAKLERRNNYGISRTQPPFLDEYIALLNPQGQVMKKISLIAAFLHSPYADLLNRSTGRDITHANAIDYIDAATAAKFPFAKEGDLLISLRNMDTIAVLDPRTQAIVWARTGFWKGQHDPTFLENGHMLVFDNHCYDGQCFPPGLRIAEFDPASGALLWEFDGKHREGMIRGQAQRLPNGNTFIAESQAGRLLEVTPQHDIVWEYYNPLRAGEHQEYIGYINFAQRFPENYFTFLPANH